MQSATFLLYNLSHVRALKLCDMKASHPNHHKSVSRAWLHYQGSHPLAEAKFVELPHGVLVLVRLRAVHVVQPERGLEIARPEGRQIRGEKVLL
jgi:hypothetical protein